MRILGHEVGRRGPAGLDSFEPPREHRFKPRGIVASVNLISLLTSRLQNLVLFLIPPL